LKSKRFRLGIAEIDQSSGFALFQQLGIKNMIATSNTPVISPYYHLLGMPMPYEVPGFLFKINVNTRLISMSMSNY